MIFMKCLICFRITFSTNTNRTHFEVRVEESFATETNYNRRRACNIHTVVDRNGIRVI